MSICTNCGNEIPKQRLDLFPETNLCSAKCIENIIEILQKPLLILNTLVIFIYVQLTFNFIKATLEFDLSLDVPILFIYMILVCSFISLRLFKQK